MKCAVSFLTVIVLSTAVGVTALLIIWFTKNEDYCGDESTNPRKSNFRCLVNGRCLTPKQTCDKKIDCPDGSDEKPFFCNDLVTLARHIDLLFPPRNNNTGNMSQIEQKPEVCEFMVHHVGVVGAVCNGAWMNQTISFIPWDEFDEMSKTISIHTGALNTTMLQRTSNNSSDSQWKFPNLTKIYISDNYIEAIGDNAFCNLPALEWLTLSGNSLRNLSSDAFCLLESVTMLNLGKNNLTLAGFRFKNLPLLGVLQLDENDIEEITEFVFSELEVLEILYLSNNRIKILHERAFLNNKKLIELHLSYNKLHQLPEGVFYFKSNLLSLYLNGNPKFNLSYPLFRDLTSLVSLNVETLSMSQIDTRNFDHTPNLDLIYFKKFSYCKYVPRARRCYPSSDGLSSNLNLLIGQSRVTVWLVGILTLLGNMFVLAQRWGWIFQLRKTNHPPRSQGIKGILNTFVTNLAIADMLMGVYLLVLAWKDVQFRGIYSVKAYEWAKSGLCTTIGILALISSEVSLLTLTILSLDRYLTIKCLFSPDKNLTVDLTRASMLVIWVFTGILALAPAIQWKNDDHNTGFYGSTGLCFPIHLNDRYPVGWQYTTFVFIGVNSCCLVLITVSYCLLYIKVRRTQEEANQRDTDLRSRFFLTVFTDVLCWAPIIILKAMVLNGYVLSNETIGWTVIYILPINSAVNPILYTFSIKEIRKAVKLHFSKFCRDMGLNRLIPTSRGNSIELQLVTRNLFGKSRSAATRGSDPDQPINTAGTEDTEMTHSACPTLSAPEARSWYN